MHNIQNQITHSYEQTQKLAEKFAKGLKGGEVICLYGDLGFGKTTFIQGLAEGLGIRSKVTSPTFIIMRSYKAELTPKVAELIMFYHVDLYRINKEQEVVDLGLLDIMHNKESITAIEWPEKMGNLLPDNRIDIKFEYISENKRSITINVIKAENNTQLF